MDLVIKDGDLSVEYGELKVLDDASATVHNLHRLLNSHYTLYAKPARASNSLTILDPDYKSDILYFLSTDTNQVLSKAEEIIRENVKQLENVSIQSVDVRLTQLDKVNIDIEYTVNNSQIELITINGN